MSPGAVPQEHSQPSLGFPSQSPKPTLQPEYVHEPAVHAMPVALRTVVLQFLVHEPQCVTDVLMFVSQPVLPGLQCAKPAAHAHVQLLAEHFGVPLSVLHAIPQAPQLSGSLVVSRQRPLQHDLPFAHVLPASRSQPSTHWPAGLHFCVPVQSVLVTHWTHWCDVGSHARPCGQLASPTHSTHVPWAVSQ